MQTENKLNIKDLEDNVTFEALDRAYKYLHALGFFTSPTNEGRVVENLLIQARIRNNKGHANTLLYEDSVVTANKCGLLPSELLKQRDELRYALEALHCVVMQSTDRVIFDNGMNAETVANAKNTLTSTKP
jgi:hypothetical protein